MFAEQISGNRLRLTNSGGVVVPMPSNTQEWSMLARDGVYDVWLKSHPYRTKKPPFDRPFIHDYHASSWPLPNANAVDDLDKTIGLLRCHAAGPTPVWRGLSLLKRWYTRNPERWETAETDLPDCNETAPNITRPLAWTKERQYVTAIDQRAAYLAAERRVPLGAGHLIPTKTVLWQPGFWHITPADTINGWSPAQRAGWYDTSTLRILDHMGIGFTVNNGYVWSQQSTPLRGWAELLGKALESYSLSRPYIKAIYTRTMGKVASKSARFWYSRPDWWRAIVAASNLRLWWLANATPYAAGISVDTLYIVTQGTPDLLPEVTKRLGDKPGQYRILWTKPLPPTVARLFGRIPATKLAEELARYGNL